MLLATVAAFIRRDVQVARSYRLAFLLDAASAAFTVVTFSLVALLVGPQEVPGGYFAFVTLGLALAGFVTSAVSVVAGNLRQEQVQGTIEVLLACGLPVSVLGAGMAAYPLVAAAARAVLYIGLAAALGARAPDANWGLGVVTIVLGSVSFAGLGLIGASLVLVVRQAAAATAWLVSVLMLAGGTLFPPHLLPEWASWAASVSPFTHTLQLTRSAVLEGAAWGSSWPQLMLIAVLAAAFVGLGIVALAGGLSLARRAGTIGQY